MKPAEVIGRLDEATRLRAALEPDDAVVAVVGPGGAGKTHLVKAVVEGVLADVSLCADAQAVAESVAAAMGLALDGVGDVARVGRVLAERRDTLVLDGCEPVLDAVLGCVWEWRGACRIVMTSRIRPIGFPVVTVGPLGLPVAPVDVLASEAGRLFLNRAQLVRPGWRPDADELPRIAEILRRLDGLPLAIELAAARLRILGTRQLLEHLEQRFRLLSGPNASLQGVLEASWALLEPAERGLVTRLAWFRSGFGLEAVEELAGDSIAAVDLLQQLQDHSLVRTWEPPRLPGVLWYGLYDSVREFALRQGEVPSAAHWLVAHCFALSAGATGADVGPVLERLAQWAPDLEAALAEGIAAGDVELATRAALALDPLFKMRGPVRRRREVLAEVLPLGGTLADVVYLTAIDARAAKADLDRLARIADGGGRRAAWAGRSLARELADLNDLDGALARAEQAVAHDPRDVRAHAVLGEILLEAGRPREAAITYRRGLDIARSKGEKRYEAGTLGFLGIVEQELGRHAEATAALQEAIALLRSLGDDRGASLYTQTLGELALEQGDTEGAIAAFTSARAGLKAVGEQRWQSYCLAGTGFAHALRRETETARTLLTEAVALSREHDGSTLRCVVLSATAAFEALTGGLGVAERLLDEAKQAASSRIVGTLAAAECAVELGRAFAARAGGDLDAYGRHREAAVAGLSGSSGWRVEGRLIGRWVELHLAERPSRRPDLVCAEDAAWFEIPGQPRVSLETRVANRRLLLCLIEAHGATPGVPVSVPDLVAAGWPGERMLPTAGASRVYTAIATLRRAGLKSFIEKVGSGYMIRDEAVIARG
ncbi:MAG: tetratricopeptide repeat protein [Alphaproteobacteria bacterium]|nr:tetratricopeptide repeat protein [Alphaproteobacteria bacterium]